MDYKDTKNGFWGNADVHPPMGFHAFAAAMSGRFVAAPFDNYEEHIEWANIILINIEYAPKMAEDIIRQIKLKNKKVIISWKENGCRWHQELCKRPMHIYECAQVFKLADKVTYYPHRDIMKNLYKSIDILDKVIDLHSPMPMSDNLIRDRYKKYKSGVFVGIGYDRNPEINKGFWENLSEAIILAKEEESVFVRGNSHDIEFRLALKMLYKDKVKIINHTNNFYEWLDILSNFRLVVNNDISRCWGRISADTRFVYSDLIDRNTELGLCDEKELYYETFRNKILELANA